MARNQRNHETLKYTVSVADVLAFARNVDQYMAPYVPVVEKYAIAIASEVAAFDENRENDPRTHAQCAVTFAILSPQCKFAVNVRAGWRLMCHLYDHIDTSIATYDENGPFGKGTYSEAIVRILTDDGADNFLTAKPASVKLARSLDYIRDLDDECMSLDAMRQAAKDGAVVGLADKTMRMALALYDGRLPLYTLDVHMLRGIQTSHGGTIAGTMTIKTKAYDMLEAVMVDWHERTFPNLPTFVSQWALWNEWGFGRHQSHVAIFGL